MFVNNETKSVKVVSVFLLARLDSDNEEDCLEFKIPY
jgi:hypothetical protein